MGNLKARLKATLLRRDSRQKSPSPSKNSFGREYASSASTHTQPGYDASDERSDHQVRRSSRSLSQERAIARSKLLDNKDESNNAHSPAPDDGDAAAHVDDEPRNESGQTRPHAPGNDGDFHAGGTDSSTAGTTPASPDVAAPGTAPGTAPGAAPAQAPSLAQARGNDRHRLGANSRDGTSATTTAPTSIAPPAGGFAVAAAAATTAAATAPVPTADTPLPSIHEHPATPPTLSSTYPESEVASPGLGVIATNLEHDYDGIANPIDDNLHSLAALPSPTASSPLRPPLSPSSFSRPLGVLRRQSILPAHQTNIVRALLNGPASDFELDAAEPDHQYPLLGMVARKVWVKRPSASATLITINEDDLVDDLREQILRKYANSLGRQYDAPDLTLRIYDPEQQISRQLQPDEPVSKVIDSYYANGQSVGDALTIEIHSRRTPKASPNPRFYADDRPHESGNDYFPPYQPQAHPHHPVTTTLVNGQPTLHFPPSMSIVSGNPLPPMPSPGSTRRVPANRPNMLRMHTASPVSTIANSHTSQAGAPVTGTHKYPRPARSRTHSGASSDQSNHPPAAPPIPTPPPVERTATPPPRVSSPRPSVRTKKKRLIETPTLGLLDTAVPPINILIVEDNMINLRLLEAFVKRLKVRWQTAVNGREAVDKWRAGGFHLVLMDIQLPIMNGLDATREIRRIEKVNSIGVFSSSASSPPDEVLPEPAEEDRLANTEMFKSPVIIVALTASSLQSDRHEALAAGCNDFLTKPVNFDWLQRKVKEWGCMQALIDFDGWRKWKDFSQKTEADEAAKKAAAASKAKPAKKNRVPMTAAA